MTYEKLIVFLPIKDPGIPLVYEKGTAKGKDLYQESPLGKSQYYNDFQQMNNHEAIMEGNRAASDAVDKYNADVKRYFDNGGIMQSTYKLPYPDDLELERYYEPAVVATTTTITNPKPWTLPPDTILWIYEKDLEATPKDTEETQS